MRVYSWEWGPDRWGPTRQRRPGLPWIGIFLLVFGGLLVLQQLYPEARSLGSLLVLAIGLAFLIRWAMTRGTGLAVRGRDHHGARRAGRADERWVSAARALGR